MPLKKLNQLKYFYLFINFRDKCYLQCFYIICKSSCGIVVIAFIIKVEVQRFESVHGHFFAFFSLSPILLCKCVTISHRTSENLKFL